MSMIYSVLHVSIGAGFLPSTVWRGQDFFWGAFFEANEKCWLDKSFCPIRLSPETPPAHSVALDGYIDLSVKSGERLAGFLANKSLYVTVESLGSASSPQAKNNSTQKQPRSLAAIFLYLSRKLLPFIIFTKDLIFINFLCMDAVTSAGPSSAKDEQKEGRSEHLPSSEGLSDLQSHRRCE